MNTEMVLPTAMKEKRLPAAACVMANSSSIIGRRGEKDILTQKLRNQRPQKITRRRIFMVAGYTGPEECASKNNDVHHVPHHTSFLSPHYTVYRP
jgi:hypothetical protein